IRRAEQLGDDIEKVKGTALDKGVELDALVKLSEPERKELIERAASGEKKVSAREVLKEKEAKRSPKERREKPEDRDKDVSWTASGEPTSEQLQAIRALNDAQLCAFLLKVEGLGLIPALKSLARAA